MAKDIVTLYQQRLKTQELKGGGGGGESKPFFFGLFLLFVLVLKVWKKLVRLAEYELFNIIIIAAGSWFASITSFKLMIACGTKGYLFL